MFLLNRPSNEAIARFINANADVSFGYKEVGATAAMNPPPSYNIDHNRVWLGEGREIFNKATAALQAWKMFDFSWVHLCWPNAPIEQGSVVGILVNHLGFWSLNAARIVYVIDEIDGVERYGFAYGTLADHAESGEERFLIEYNLANASVWYDLYAFSQPKQLMASLGYPISRWLQKRFAIDSMKAMSNAVALR